MQTHRLSFAFCKCISSCLLPFNIKLFCFAFKYLHVYKWYLQVLDKLNVLQVLVVTVTRHISCLVVVDMSSMRINIPNTRTLSEEDKKPDGQSLKFNIATNVVICVDIKNISIFYILLDSVQVYIIIIIIILNFSFIKSLIAKS